MRLLLQRVTRARVEVRGETIGAIEQGLLVLLAVLPDDVARDADWLIDKLLGLRVFDDSAGKMNRSVVEEAGSVLVVSQFTLAGDVGRGRRPSFIDAAPPAQAEALYEYFVARLRTVAAQCTPPVPVATGAFGADMQVHLVNDGPVTLLIDSPPARDTN